MSFLKNPAIIRTKSTPTQTSVLAEYLRHKRCNNFGRTFKGSEDMVTKTSENWPLSTTLLSIDASSSENHSEYPHKPYIKHRKLESLANCFVADGVWEYLQFHAVVSESEAEISSRTYHENRF